MRSILFPSLPGSRLRFFIAGQIQHRTVHLFFYTPAKVDAPIMYSSINSRLYAKNPVFEIVHEETVKVSIMYTCTTGLFNRTLCVESCVTEEFHISPRFSPVFFHRDAMCCASFVSIMH